jgi:protein-L-isoaspartate O-methyltransferase
MHDDRPDDVNPADTTHADVFARLLAQIEHDGQADVARAASVSEVGTARSYEVATVARAAMREAVHLTELERQLAGRSAVLGRRLRLLGDVAMVCLAEIIRAATRDMTGGPSREVAP